MAKYTEAQLSGMAVNPETKGRIVDAYPHIGQLLHDADLTQGETEDVLIRYLAYAYDWRSPLVRAYPDPRIRIQQAAAITGLKWKEEYNKAFLLFQQRVTRNMEWRNICAAYHLYNEFEEQLYAPIKTGEDVKDTDIINAQQKKTALKKEMREIATDMPGMIENFFNGDKEMEKKITASTDWRPEAMTGRITKR